MMSSHLSSASSRKAEPSPRNHPEHRHPPTLPRQVPLARIPHAFWHLSLLSCHTQQGQITERTDGCGIADAIQLDPMLLEPMGIGGFADGTVSRPMRRGFMPTQLPVELFHLIAQRLRGRQVVLGSLLFLTTHSHRDTSCRALVKIGTSCECNR